MNALDMTVESPEARVVRHDAENHVVICGDEECIAPQRLLDVVLLSNVSTGADGHDPWRIPMDMERVIAVVETGDLYIHHVHAVFSDVELVATRRGALRCVGGILLNIEQRRTTLDGKPAL